MTAEEGWGELRWVRVAEGGRRVEPQEGQTFLFIWPEPAVFVCGGRTTESIRDDVRPDLSIASNKV